LVANLYKSHSDISVQSNSSAQQVYRVDFRMSLLLKIHTNSARHNYGSHIFSWCVNMLFLQYFNTLKFI